MKSLGLLGAFNYCIAQFFCCRLTTHTDVETGKLVGLSWMYPVAPYTGWNDTLPFYLSADKKPKHRFIWKKKLKGRTRLVKNIK